MEGTGLSGGGRADGGGAGAGGTGGGGSAGGAYARAIEEAVKELRASVPGVVSEAAGVAFSAKADGSSGGVFAVPYLDTTLQVLFPEGVVLATPAAPGAAPGAAAGGSATGGAAIGGATASGATAGSGHEAAAAEGGAEAVVAVTIVVLHYLARSVGPLDLSDPVRFAGLPGAGAYTAAFRSHAEVPLLQRFGEDGQGYMRALTALGGHPAEGEHDPEVVWEVPFLPHLPLGLRLGLAEGAMPAECVIMFPRRSGFAYHVEDLAVAGELLSARLLEVAEVLEEGGTEADLALLATFFDPTEAELVVSKLRSAGIEALVQGDALSVVYGLTMEGHARHHVFVRTEDVVEARGALDLGAPDTGSVRERGGD